MGTQISATMFRISAAGSLLILVVYVVAEENEQRTPNPLVEDSRELNENAWGVPSDPLNTFHRMDVNKDKVLESSELTDADFLHHYGTVHGGESAEVSRIINAMDNDGDGSINKEEFLAYTSPIAEKAFALSDFTDADTDNSGSLSFDEWQFSSHAVADGVPSPAGKPHTDPKLVQQLTKAFARLDANKDKAVSREEYLSEQGLDKFAQCDTNTDGQIDQAEYEKQEARHSVGAKEAGRAFLEMDRDHNGGLSRVEHRGDYSLSDYAGMEPEHDKATFALLDANKDGHVSFDEYNVVGADFTRDEFSKLDTNADGQVDVTEYLDYQPAIHRGLSDL